MNFDGTMKGNPSLVGCGGVLRDEYGLFIVVVALSLGKKNNRLAEVVVA